MVDCAPMMKKTGFFSSFFFFRRNYHNLGKITNFSKNVWKKMQQTRLSFNGSK